MFDTVWLTITLFLFCHYLRIFSFFFFSSNLNNRKTDFIIGNPHFSLFRHAHETKKNAKPKVITNTYYILNA